MNVNANFDLVMFDLDGTLVATAAEIQDAVNDTLRRFNLPEVDQARVEGWIGHGTQELLLQALAYASHTPVAVIRAGDSLALVLAEFERNYGRRCGTRSHLYPFVNEVLTELRRRGVKLALVTNKEERYTRVVLEAHGLAPLLDRVVAGDSLATKKPDPAGLLSCLAAFRVAPERALFVGDSSIDIDTARNAGVRVWAVPYGYSGGAPVASLHPDRLIDDLRVLLPVTDASLMVRGTN